MRPRVLRSEKRIQKLKDQGPVCLSIKPCGAHPIQIPWYHPHGYALEEYRAFVKETS